MSTSKLKKNKNPHDGSTLDEFLEEEGILEEVQAAALKRAMALSIADLMEQNAMSKTTLAKRMRTSRAALDRLLDPSAGAEMKMDRFGREERGWGWAEAAGSCS